LRDLFNQWLGTASPDQQASAWHDILQVWADEVFSIGTVGGVLQPVVVSDKLRNVPDKGVYNWDPGAFFGIYKPDHFWLATEPGAKSAAADAASPVATP
jgi:peptide/nickel transport system substrate-binding protein